MPRPFGRHFPRHEPVRALVDLIDPWGRWRFVKMLDTIRGNTQFILYGVTMEEPGVSKLVSVKFN